MRFTETWGRGWRWALLAGVSAAWAGAAAAETGALEALRRERSAAANRPRRIVFNNDGCDAVYFPADREVTPEQFLAIRTTPLLGSQVDTISYCTISSGFGYFTHRTRVGDLLTKEWDAHRERGEVNAVQALLDQGTDPLQAVVEFGRQHGIEVFWSMRMNDVHDASHTPENPYPLFSPLKERHPEYLMGTFRNRPTHGHWSAVDYTRPEIRELAFRFIEEVCQNYDVDGVELDFFRHLHYFRSVSWGGQASAEELELMTDLLRRVRSMTEAEGLRRGRPYLVAVRVPDSVGYARGLGLDIERWLAEGLVDLLFTTGYFRLNEWDVTVALAHRYGVKAYPGLSETRIVRPGEGRRDVRRASDAAYRARAAAAWQAGADGIYVFNEYTAGRRYLREIGDPAALAGLDQTYFATVRGRANAAFWLNDGETHLRRPVLNPQEPEALSFEQPFRLDLALGAWPGDGAQGAPRVTAWVETAGIGAPGGIALLLNGRPLDRTEQSGEELGFDVDPAALRPGTGNLFEVARHRVSTAVADQEEPDWIMAYDGRKLLRWPDQLPWRRAFPAPSWIEEIRDEALYFADVETGGQDMAHLVYPWRLAPDARARFEAEVRFAEGDDPLAVCIRFANGRSVEYLTFEEDRVGLHFAGLSASVDTVSRFRVYRVELDGADVRVYLDDELLLDGAGRFTTPADDQDLWLPLTHGLMEWNRNSLLIGSASGPGTGAAYWRNIRFASDTLLLRDFRLDVSFQP